MTHFFQKHKVALLFYFLVSALHYFLYKFLNIYYELLPDAAHWTYPYLSVIKSGLTEGSIPFWNSFVNGGYPILLTGNFAIKALPLLYKLSIVDVMVLHSCFAIFFANFSMYLLCSSALQSSLKSSLFAGIFWGLSSYFVIYHYLLGSLEAHIWAPVFCLALIYSRKNLFLSMAVITIGSCEQFLSGRVQEIEVATLLVVVFIFYYVWNYSGLRTTKEKLQQVAHYALVHLGSVLLMFIIVAPSVYEQFHMFINSSRGGTSPGILQCTPSILNFLTVIPHSESLFRLSGGCNNEAYIGIMGLALILLAIKFNWKQIKVLLLIAFSVMIFVHRIKIGTFSLFELYTYLPGHIGIRYSSRFLPFMFFFLSLALAKGLDKIDLVESFKKSKWIMIALLLLNFEFLSSLIRFHITKEKWFTYDIGFLVLVVLMLQLIWLIFSLINKNQKAAWASIFVVFISCTYFINWTYTRGLKPGAYFAETYENSELKDIVSLVDKNKTDYRFVCEGGTDPRGGCAYLVSNGFRIVSGYFTFTNRRMYDYFTQVLKGEYIWSFDIAPTNIDSKMFYLSNVKYWLHKKEGNNEIPSTNQVGFKKIYSSKNYELYEFESVLPRAYFVDKIEVIEQENEINSIKQKLSENKNWFNNNAYLLNDEEYKNTQPASNLSQDTQKIIKTTEYKNSKFTFTTRSSRDQYLVLSDYLTKYNWKAFVDGIETPLLRANLISTALFLPAGEHEIVFKYQLPQITLVLMALGLVILLVLLSLGIIKISLYSKKQ